MTRPGGRRVCYFVLALCLSVAPGPAVADERIDKLFAVWQQAQRETRSLLIEGNVEEYNAAFGKRTSEPARLRLARNDAGVLSGTLEPERRKDSGYQLHDGRLYLLSRQNRFASRFEFEEHGLQLFLEWYLSPLVVLVDRQRAEERYKLEVIQEDDESLWLLVEPKQPRASDRMACGGVVLAKRASADIPFGFPRRLWFRTPTPEGGGLEGDEVDIVVRRWRMNAEGGPKPADFVRPEDLPGWSVDDFSFPYLGMTPRKPLAR